MPEDVERIADLLREVADLHHRYYRLTDGADEDWPTFYARWLVHHSELPDVLGQRPARSEVVHLLVRAERELADAADWAAAYAELLVRQLRR